MSAARTALSALATGAVLTGVAFATLGRDGSRPPPPADVSVTVDPHALGTTVPRSFLGLSIEWNSVLPYTGHAGRRETALLRLLAPVARAAGAPLALRIGGDSGDQAWWNPGRRPRPPTILQDVGPPALDGIGWLARGLGGPVTLGLNLALDDPGNALAMTHAAARRLPPGAIHALEIGNEPDLYTHGHSFRRGGHVHRRVTKDPNYSEAAYARAVGRYLPVLGATGLHPAPRLVVGGFAAHAWWPALAGRLATWRGRADEVAAHLYALSDCAAKTPPLEWLMSAAASRHRVASLRPLAAIARRAGVPLRLAELNSAACGGRPHWSDTSAGALWLADTLFAALRLGVVEADVHTWKGSRYAPFAVQHDGVHARPPLNGLLAFAHAAPAGSRLVRTTVRGTGSLRTWATIDGRGTTRVLLLAPDGGRARVRAPRGVTGCATLWRPGRSAVACPCPVHGRYVIHLARHALAVLTLPPSGATRRAPCGSAP